MSRALAGKEPEEGLGLTASPFESPSDIFLQGLSFAVTRKPLTEAKKGNCVYGKKNEKDSLWIIAWMSLGPSSLPW